MSCPIQTKEINEVTRCSVVYRGADNFLARSRRKQARKHISDKRELSSSFFSPLQGKAPKEIPAILTETLAYFLPGRAKDLSAPL